MFRMNWVWMLDSARVLPQFVYMSDLGTNTRGGIMQSPKRIFV